MRIVLAKFVVIFSLIAVSLYSDARPAKQSSIAKQRDEQRKARMERVARKHLHANAPREFFKKFIAENYALVNGEVLPVKKTKYRVLQVVDERTLLMVKGYDYSAGPITIAVTVKSTVGVIDDQRIVLALVPTGTYKYISVTGANKTIQAYKETDGLSFKEYMRLRNDGYKFPEDP